MQERLSVPARVDALDVVIAFVCRQLASRECSEWTMTQLQVAVEEIFVNISSYAYHPGSGRAEVCCEVLEDPPRAVIQFLDSGKPFNPLEKEDADTSEDALMERVGGLGIYMVKNTMDDVHYAYENGKNVLTIEKRL